MKMFVISGYKDKTIRLGMLDREWISKSGIPLVTLKILDHYKEHKTVYRTYHAEHLKVMKVLDIDEDDL